MFRNKFDKIAFCIDEFEKMVRLNKVADWAGFAPTATITSILAAPAMAPAGLALDLVGKAMKKNKTQAPPTINAPASQPSEMVEEPGDAIPVPSASKAEPKKKETSAENKTKTPPKDEEEEEEYDADLNTESDDEILADNENETPVSKPSVRGGGGSKKIDSKYQKIINFYLEKWQQDKIEEDGLWGPKTQKALDFISSLYENKYKFKSSSDLGNLEQLYNNLVESLESEKTSPAKPSPEKTSPQMGLIASHKTMQIKTASDPGQKFSAQLINIQKGLGFLKDLFGEDDSIGDLKNEIIGLWQDAQLSSILKNLSNRYVPIRENLIKHINGNLYYSEFANNPKNPMAAENYKTYVNEVSNFINSLDRNFGIASSQQIMGQVEQRESSPQPASQPTSLDSPTVPKVQSPKVSPFVNKDSLISAVTTKYNPETI
jgi:hypothetical protein